MNTVLRELGFSPGDRVVVVHADDIGMCHATVPAIAELMASSVVTSASVMVPCPWFFEAMEWHRRNPEFGLGVHLTLTSEWKHYRWGPVSTRVALTGLLDSQGCFHGTVAAVRKQADRKAVRDEMGRQVELAERAGLHPTHIDNHMYVAMCNEFHQAYLEVACEREIPAFMTRVHGGSPDQQGWFRRRASDWLDRGQPVFDHLRVVTRTADVANHDVFVRQVFDHLPAGLSCVLLHPAIDTPEIRRITGDWQGRVADFEVFRQPSLREHIRRVGIHLISYQPLREAMRRQRGRCSR